MKTKTILKSVENDIYELIADCEKANEQYSQKKLTTKKYESLRYIYSCRALYLQNVVELAKKEGISFELPVKMNKLPSDFTLEEINLEAVIKFVAEDLSSKVDLKQTKRLVGLKAAMTALSKKYSRLLPNEQELVLD